MDILNYYQKIWPVTKNCFSSHARFFIATHKQELLARGWNPNTHPLVEVLELPENLDMPNFLQERTCHDGYEVFLPIVGRNNNTVLFPFDCEIFLDNENHKIYTDRSFHNNMLENHIKPVCDLLETQLMQHNIPYIIDYTPSGFHLLFLAQRNTSAWQELAKIGYLEEEMQKFISTQDSNDVKRKVLVDQETALVFSGMGRLAEYLCLLLFKKYNMQKPSIPAAVCDSIPRCINLDLSWAGDSAIMRCMRSLAGAHRKKYDRYNVPGEPLVDVIYSYYDGKERLSLKQGSSQVASTSIGETNISHIIEAMWNKEQAANISLQYQGIVPRANDSIISLIEQYKKSKLYAFHQDFDSKESLHEGEGIYRFHHDSRLDKEARNRLYYPVPAFLQPMVLRRFIKHCFSIGWHPKHIGNGIRDIYKQNEFRFPFHKYPPETKANFYARLYSAMAMNPSLVE
ncbi:MAG: hypothetical protein HUU50_21850 [Candidatus Brocadiae bacterium]|nr:hypothetical protein [Candidatus Brocadiia bacterium]